MKIYPIIISGGKGSRLWPLSRSLFPKQFLDLAGPKTMLQETALRVQGADFALPFILCNAEHRFLVAEQFRVLGLQPSAIVLEPVGRDTAPAAAVAALMVADRDPDGMVLLLPADHLVADIAKFQTAVAQSIRAVQDGYLVTFGIIPRSPETGYGYIQHGTKLYESFSVQTVTRFVEKPDRNAAERYLAEGDYYWNSGIFAFQATAFLAELDRLNPDIVRQCRTAVAEGQHDLNFFRLAEAPFEACPSISIDYAVMEHTRRAAVVPSDFGWSDIGSWESLWKETPKDADGNVLRGDVMQQNARNSYLRSDGPLVAAVGVENIVVVATADAVLVAAQSATQDVKKMVEALERSGRALHVSHRKVYRPWGAYEGLDHGDCFQVKRITVNPGAKLSLQMHHKRAEHWVVVSGTAQVTCDDRVFKLKANESTFIPLGALHRLENTDTTPLELIEIQSGSYLGEDDIVRFEDSYGRR